MEIHNSPEEYIDRLISEVHSATESDYSKAQINEYFTQVRERAESMQEAKANNQGSRIESKTNLKREKDEVEEIVQSDEQPKELKRLEKPHKTQIKKSLPPTHLPQKPPVEEKPKVEPRLKPENKTTDSAREKKRKRSTNKLPINVNYYLDNEAKVNSESENDEEMPVKKQEEVEKIMPKNVVIDSDVMRIFTKYAGFICMAVLNPNWHEILQQHIAKNNSKTAREQIECYEKVFEILTTMGHCIKNHVSASMRNMDNMKHLHYALMSESGFADFEFADISRLEGEIMTCAIDGTSVKKGQSWNIVFYLDGAEKEMVVGKPWAEFITCWQTLTKQEFLIRAAFVDFADTRPLNGETATEFLASEKINELATFLVATLSYFYKFIKNGPEVSTVLKNIDKAWISIVS